MKASEGVKKSAQILSTISPAEASSNAGSAKLSSKFQREKVTKTAGQTGKREESVTESLSKITLSNSTVSNQHRNNRNFGRGQVDKDGIVIRVDKAQNRLFVSCSDGSEVMVAKGAIDRKDLRNMDDNIADFKGYFRSTNNTILVYLYS